MATIVGHLNVILGLDNSGLKKGLKESEKFMGDFRGKVKTFTSSVSGMMAGMFTIYGAKTLASGLWDVAAGFEQMEAKLDTLSKGNGKEILEELNTLALDLPVSTEELVKSFTALVAMGVKPTTKEILILSDAMSILGDDVGMRVARQLGQMSTVGKVMQEDIKVLSEAGIAASQYLKDAYGMTIEEIRESGIDVREVISTIFLGMEKQFGGASERMKTSGIGLLETMRSYAVEVARTVMGAGVYDEVKKQIDSINKAMKDWLGANKDTLAEDVAGYIQKIKEKAKQLWDIVNYDPAILEFGILGLVLFGKKGFFILGAIAHLVTMVENLAKAFDLVKAGVISFGDVATANFKELDKLVKDNEDKLTAKIKVDIDPNIDSDNIERMMYDLRNKRKTELEAMIKEEEEILEQTKTPPTTIAPTYYANRMLKTKEVDDWKRELDEIIKKNKELNDVMTKGIEVEKKSTEQKKSLIDEMAKNDPAKDKQRLLDQYKKIDQELSEYYKGKSGGDTKIGFDDDSLDATEANIRKVSDMIVKDAQNTADTKEQIWKQMWEQMNSDEAKALNDSFRQIDEKEKALEELKKKSNKTLETLSTHTYEAMQDGFADFIYNASEGINDLENIITSFLQSVRRAISQYMAQNLMQALFGDGKSGSGWMNTIGSAFGSWVGSGSGYISPGNADSMMAIDAQNHATGGYTLPNKRYIVGEKGPELLEMGSNRGFVHPDTNVGNDKAKSIDIAIHNESGEKLMIRRQQGIEDSQKLQVSLWIDAYDRNVGGLREVMGG